MIEALDRVCPCGSDRVLAECCGPYLKGKLRPPTAEALMRSRYTAYVLRDEAYLRSTWHPRTCPGQLGLDDGDAAWEGLTVLRCRAGGATDKEGEVEFVARYGQGGTSHQLHEVSRFVRENEQWYYLDGSLQTRATAVAKPGRNDPCPCGSGKKFKKCCGG